MIVNNILGCSHYETMETEAMTWLMPDESEPHDRTWMAFGANRAIWGQRLLPEVQNNLATIAKAIAHYEPVSMLVRPEEYEIAAQKCGSSVNLVVSALDDLWIRDTGPVFVKDSRGRLGGIDFNFNGWGQKQEHGQDANVAEFITQESGVQPIQTQLVLEGGGIEVDGKGTAIITESCVLNGNRNPGLSKTECEALLKPLLGLRKIIWLPGIRVIMPEFGDVIADDKAKSTVQDLFPDRDIVQLNIDAIAAGGGGIHCTTQQQPRA